MRTWGFTADAAADGEEALAILQTAVEKGGPLPDLMLLDLNVPKLDGRELLARVKRDPEVLHVPIVVLTSSTNDADIRTSYRLHANCYIKKPAEFGRLSSMMRMVHDFWLYRGDAGFVRARLAATRRRRLRGSPRTRACATRSPRIWP